MMDRIQSSVQVQGADGAVTEATLSYSRQPPWRMELELPGQLPLSQEKGDLFECMQGIRLELEKSNCLLLCNGARRDVYPSSMSRDMGGGFVAYAHSMGRSPERADIVKIVERAAADLVSTVAEQQDFYSRWTRSLG